MIDGKAGVTEQRRHIATLDGLRGAAAVAVVWYHMTYQAFHMPSPFHGYLAVDFFFILSGLVVAGAYEKRLQSGMFLVDFVKIRLIRLYPLIALAVLCGFISKIVAFYHYSHHVSEISSCSAIFAALLFGLLLLPYSGMYGVDADMFPLDTPLWSLMFEIWANLFYAIIASSRHSGILKVVTFGAILLGAAALIPCALAQNGLSGGHSVATFWTGMARVSCAFFIGIALHRFLTPERIAALPSVPFPLLTLLLLIVLFAGPKTGALYDVFAVLVIFPIIVVLGAKDCITPKWRSVALFAGALSYPVYVLHNATFVHLKHFQNKPTIEMFLTFIVVFLAVILISFIALRFYDEPVRRWLTRIMRSSAGAKPPKLAVASSVTRSE